MADPGFPVGGRAPIRGGVDLQCGHFLVKMYVKTKELGPMGGVRQARPPRSANALTLMIILILQGGYSKRIWCPTVRITNFTKVTLTLTQ